MKVVKKLEAVDVTQAIHPRRRLIVVQREDGHFSFAEEYFYISEHEGEVILKGWRRLPPNGLYPTAEIAEDEGFAAFARWHNLVI